MKVVIHTLPYVTNAGWTCTNWFRWHVYVGENPRGPRGGRVGNCVDGRWVGGPFHQRDEAEAFAAAYAKQNKFELL